VYRAAEEPWLMSIHRRCLGGVLPIQGGGQISWAQEKGGILFVLICFPITEGERIVGSQSALRLTNR
jgi:hypothetical protein